MSRIVALALGCCALAAVALLLLWDVVPAVFPNAAHQPLGAAPLALIAVAYLAYQIHARPSPAELLRAAILALAFLCWAENQVLGDGPLATLFNDLAIALFVFDVFLTMLGWPAGGAKEPELL